MFKNTLLIPGYELQTFSTVEKDFFHKSLDNWSDASGITFIEVEDTNDVYGEIRFHLLDYSLYIDSPEYFLESSSIIWYSVLSNYSLNYLFILSGSKDSIYTLI